MLVWRWGLGEWIVEQLLEPATEDPHMVATQGRLQHQQHALAPSSPDMVPYNRPIHGLFRGSWVRVVANLSVGVRMLHGVVDAFVNANAGGKDFSCKAKASPYRHTVRSLQCRISLSSGGSCVEVENSYFEPTLAIGSDSSCATVKTCVACSLVSTSASCLIPAPVSTHLQGLNRSGGNAFD